MVLQQAHRFMFGHALLAVAFCDNCAFRWQKLDFHRLAGTQADQVTQAALPVCSSKVIIFNPAANTQRHRIRLAFTPYMLQVHGAQGHFRLQVLKAELAQCFP